MKNSNNLIAFVTALSLHLIIGAVLLLGLEFKLPKDKPKEEVVVINASIVNQKLFDDLASKKVQQEADRVAAEKRKVEQARKEKERIKREQQLAEKQRQDAENKRIEAEKAELARQKKEEERILFEEIVAAKALRAEKEAAEAKKAAEALKAKQEAERVKQEAERQKQQAEAQRVEAEKVAAAKALAEKQAAEAKLKAEKEAKIKAEKEAKLKAEKAAKLKAEKEAQRLRQAELDRQMEAEFADSFSNAKSSKQLSEIARYKALIQDKISRNWQVEQSMKGKSCTLAIRLAPDGLVLSVNRSSGDQKLCDSATRATLKAKTLPIPQDSEIAPQFRDFDITLEPDL